MRSLYIVRTFLNRWQRTVVDFVAQVDAKIKLLGRVDERIDQRQNRALPDG